MAPDPEITVGSVWYKRYFHKAKQLDDQAGNKHWMDLYRGKKAVHLAQGKSKGQAACLAKLECAAVLKEYEEARGKPVPVDETLSAFRSDEAPEIEEVRWVGTHMNNNAVARKDAPSRRAWSLREWAKREPANETKFWVEMYKPIVNRQSQSDGQAAANAEDADLEKGLIELEQLSREASAAESSAIEADV